jgi:hypothetical protein
LRQRSVRVPRHFIPIEERTVLLPPRLSRLHAATLATTLLISSCGSGGGGGDPPASPAQVVPPRPVDQSDLQIAQLLYAGTPRTPAGFQEEMKPAGQAHVSTVHLKNTDVDLTLSASSPQHELCTDDWNTALDWSETSAHESTQYADLVATDDAARYFEFGRARSGDPDFYVRQRVFKCSYLSRATADLRTAEGMAGQLNQRPLSGEELRSLSEYLWQFTSYNNFGHAVLRSSGTTTPTTLTHTLIIATVERAGISATCDQIEVIAWRHNLDAASGALQLDVETLWSFGARENAGGELCSG